MTPEERAEHRAIMRSLPPDEREAYRAPVVNFILISTWGVRLYFELVSVCIDNDRCVLPSIVGIGLKMSVATCTHINHRLLID